MTVDTYNMTAVCKTLGTANRTLYAVMDEIGVHGVKTSGGRMFTQAEVLQLGAGSASARTARTMRRGGGRRWTIRASFRETI